MTVCQTCALGYNLYSSTVCTLDVSAEQAKQVQQVTKATEAAGTTSSAVGAAYAFLNSGDPSAMLMASLVKMLQYVKYIDIVFPAKIEMMFEAQSKVNETSLNSSFFVTKIENRIKGIFYNAPLQGAFGYYQLYSSFASNFLQSLLILSGLSILICLLQVLTMLCSKSSKTHKIFARILDIFKWNLFLILFCGMYGDIIFYSSFEFGTADFDNLSSAISFTICVLVNVLAALVVIRLIQVNLNLKFSRKNRIALNHQTKSMQDAVEKWRNYKPFFEAYKSYSFSQQSFMLFFIIRVSLFYLVIAYLQDYPKVQIILINLISLAMILYLVIGRPFTKSINTLNQVIFEMTIFAFNICVFLLTFYQSENAYDFTKRETIGNIMIIMNMIAGMVSMLFICIKALVMLKEIYQNWRKSKRQKSSLRVKRSTPERFGVVDDSNLSSEQILTTSSQIRSSAGDTSNLTISNLEQTIDTSSSNRNVMRIPRLKIPQQGKRIGKVKFLGEVKLISFFLEYFPNLHTNAQNFMTEEKTGSQSRKSSKIRKRNRNLKKKPEQSNDMVRRPRDQKTNQRGQLNSFVRPYFS